MFSMPKKLKVTMKQYSCMRSQYPSHTKRYNKHLPTLQDSADCFSTADDLIHGEGFMK